MNAPRYDYMHAYYEANKERLKHKQQAREKRPRTDAARRAEARYKEKKKALAEIERFPFGVSPFDATKEMEINA